MWSSVADAIFSSTLAIIRFPWPRTKLPTSAPNSICCLLLPVRPFEGSWRARHNECRIRTVNATAHSWAKDEGISLRPLALPPEHGSWGLVFEPIILGLAIVPTWGGAAVAVAAVFSFL